jgi:hypothetical protein
MHLYEDLAELGKSRKFLQRVKGRERVLNVKNVRKGVRARRGDGTFDEPIPDATLAEDVGFLVARGSIATVEIGVEVKIVAKAMMKQIDRVISDLVKQVEHFKRGGGCPICLGIVGINASPRYTSYEGDRATLANGTKYAKPEMEAIEAERRLLADARPHFTEFLVLRFRATNVEPFPFEWVSYKDTAEQYGAILVRISREYENRF